MRKFLFIALALTIALGAESCGKKHDDSGHGKGMTKVVQVDDMQVAIDLMTMADHNNMMKMMKIEEKPDADATHSVLLTLISKNDHKVVKGAKVSIALDFGDQKKDAKEAKIYEGGGMYHYGLSVNLKGKAHLVVKVNIKSEGKDRNAQGEFHLH